jgi:hypothetical protein
MRISLHCGSTFREAGDYEFSDSTNGKIQKKNRSLTPNGNNLGVPTVTYDELERMAADRVVNLETQGQTIG